MTEPAAHPVSDLDIKDCEVTDSRLNAFAIDRLSQAFETSAKRWELIVYPTLFAFIILAAYGFYLIFSLAKDVHALSITVDSNMTAMSRNMQTMADNVTQMTRSVHVMSTSVDTMSHDVRTLQPMLASIQNMDLAMQQMTLSMSSMRTDMSMMNQTFGRPMNFMNKVMPW